MASLCNLGWILNFSFFMFPPVLPSFVLPSIPSLLTITLPTVYCPLD
jgi:hypothetical protein